MLNVKDLENSSPSWTRSVLVNDQAVKWAKAEVCVFADSVLCVGRMENDPGEAERRWKGQVGDLRMFSSYQDAVGLDSRSKRIRVNKCPRIFNIVFHPRDSAGLGEEEHPTRGLLGLDHFHVNVR